MIKFINTVSNNLVLKGGIFFSKEKSLISYPKDGNELCFQIEENSFWFKHRANCIVNVINKFAKKKVLFDVGGGNGFTSVALEKNNIDTVLVEPGIEGVFNAKKRGLKNLICATFNNAGFAKNSIPNIGIFDVLEHIENDIGFLKDLNDTLENNGKLFITVPAYNILWSNEDRYAGHYRRFTLKQMKIKLAKANFIIEYSTYIFSLLPLPIFLFRTIPSLFNKKTKKNMEHVQKEHKPNSILARIFIKEISAINNLQKIPFGGTCLIVAKKN